MTVENLLIKNASYIFSLTSEKEDKDKVYRRIIQSSFPFFGGPSIFWPQWIRIRIPNPDPDRDPLTQLIRNPDPDPKL
jgi:hypothetical protein